MNGKDEKKQISYLKMFTMIALILLVYFFAVMRGVYIENQRVEQEIAKVQTKIHNENKRRIENEKQYKVVQSFVSDMKKNGNDPVKALGVMKNDSDYTEIDYIIEEIAREKLKYVKSDEIIFIDKNK